MQCDMRGGGDMGERTSSRFVQSTTGLRKTSFGEMDHLLKLNGKIAIEYLKFESGGRAHKHNEYESFYVLSGRGQVISGDQTYQVKKGDLVTIPPQTPHWMTPDGPTPLEGFIWYHEEPLKNASHLVKP